MVLETCRPQGSGCGLLRENLSDTAEGIVIHVTHVAGYTVVAYRDLASASVAADAFLRHHPDARFTVVVLDHPLRVQLVDGGQIEYIPASQLPEFVDWFTHFAVALNQDQLTRLVRARVARYLADSCEVLIYVNHQTQIFRACDQIIEMCLQHDLVVVPRRLTPLSRDHLEPSLELIWQDFYDSGIFGLNANRTKFIDWWVDRADIAENEDSGSDYAFLDEAATLFDTGVLRQASYGGAIWNFDERTIAQHESAWWIDDELLTTFYFKGYAMNEPSWLSSLVGEKPRFLLSNLGPHGHLYLSYARTLKDREATLVEEVSNSRYGWSDVLPGVSLTPGLRHIFRNEWLQTELSALLPSPFNGDCLHAFMDWLNETSQIDDTPVQRFVLSLFIDRPDIHNAYVHGNSIDYDGLKEWIKSFGRAEYPLTRVGIFESPERSQITDLGRSKKGVDVIGSFNSEHGLGEAGRLLVDALKTTEEAISTIAYSPVGVRGKHPFVPDQKSRNHITVVALNPEQTRDLWRISGPEFRRNRYVIGQWFWELEIAPPWYKSAYSEQLIHELWAPTRFIEQMLLKSVPSHIPVRHMPLPFVRPGFDESFTLRSLGLPDRYTFLFTFDFGSVMKRKNPEAVIEAFKCAFSVADGAQLIIKSINGHRRLKQYERLRLLCQGRPDIHLIDEYFDNDLNAALIANCDCYVSLHRSEGLGLTLAEAMLLEKPVIATAYSGNMDFMTKENCFLVPWEYSIVGEDADAYPKYARWAEPKIEVAAEFMRELFSNPARGQEIGRTARNYIEAEFSPTVTGARMADRLREVRK